MASFHSFGTVPVDNEKLIMLATYTYLRRQQERGLMKKARCLMDENSVSFPNVFNSLVFYYTWFRKSNFCVQTMSEQYLEIFFFCTGGACAEAKIWR